MALLGMDGSLSADEVANVLALPKRIWGKEEPSDNTITEPTASVYTRTADPPCQVLPPTSVYDAAYDFYTLDTDPMEFAEHVSEPYRAVMQAGAARTAYDARQLIEAVKGNANSQDLPLDSRTYVLNTERGACALDRRQYVDLWRRSRGLADVREEGDQALWRMPLDELAQRLSDPQSVARVVSDDRARRLVAWRIAQAYVDELTDMQATGEEPPGHLTTAEGAILDLLDAARGVDVAGKTLEHVAMAELMLAVALQDPDALGELRGIFDEEVAVASELAIESLLVGPTLLPAEPLLYGNDTEEAASEIVDVFLMDYRQQYQDVLSIAARSGAQTLATHVMENYMNQGLDPYVAAELAAEAEAGGYDELAESFREASGRA